MIVHLRVWTSNKYDIQAACGMFTVLSPRNNGRSKLRWTHDKRQVTCKDCKKWLTENADSE